MGEFVTFYSISKKFSSSLQPKKIITTPHTTLIVRSTLALKRLLKVEMVIAKPVNHRKEAVATPQMKAVDWVGGRLALKAPSIIVPSIIAWGLNHVTTQAV